MSQLQKAEYVLTYWMHSFISNANYAMNVSYDHFMAYLGTDIWTFSRFEWTRKLKAFAISEDGTRCALSPIVKIPSVVTRFCDSRDDGLAGICVEEPLCAENVSIVRWEITLNELPPFGGFHLMMGYSLSTQCFSRMMLPDYYLIGRTTPWIAMYLS